MTEEQLLAAINRVAMKKEPHVDLSGARLKAFPVPLLNIVESGLLQGITALELSDNEIGELPAAVDCFGQLEELSLARNRLAALPRMPRLAASLHTLRLGHNSLEAFPEALCEMRQLRVLELQYNRIAALPPAIGQMQALRLLNVAANRIAELPADLFFLPGLAFVQASANLLRALPASLPSCGSLVKLAVQDNEALRELPEGLGECSLLQELRCSGTAITELPLSLADLPELCTLTIDGPVVVSKEAVAAGTAGIVKYLDMLQRFEVKRFNSQGHWEADDAAARCRGCKADFGLFKRRHHCRLCGGVYCRECLVGVFSHPRLDGLLSKSKVCATCEGESGAGNRRAPPRPQAAPQKAGGGAAAVAAPLPLPRHGLTGAERALPPQEQQLLLAGQREELERLLVKERRALAGTEKLLGFYAADAAAQAVARAELDVLRARVQAIEAALAEVRGLLSAVSPPGVALFVPPVVAAPSGRQPPAPAQRGRGTLRGRGRRGTAAAAASTEAPPPLPPRDDAEGEEEGEEDLANRPLPPLPLQEEAPAAEMAEATYAFAAESANELSVGAGERVAVVERAGAWWFVENATGRIGAVPCSYLRIL